MRTAETLGATSAQPRAGIIEEWRDSPAYLTALRLRLRFEVDCEAFDRTFPGFWRHDEVAGETWIPMSIEDRHASERFAENAARRMREAARSIGGIDPATARDAKCAANRMTYERQRETLSYLEGTAQRGEG